MLSRWQGTIEKNKSIIWYTLFDMLQLQQKCCNCNRLLQLQQQFDVMLQLQNVAIVTYPWLLNRFSHSVGLIWLNDHTLWVMLRKTSKVLTISRIKTPLSLLKKAIKRPKCSYVLHYTSSVRDCMFVYLLLCAFPRSRVCLFVCLFICLFVARPLCTQQAHGLWSFLRLVRGHSNSTFAWRGKRQSLKRERRGTIFSEGGYSNRFSKTLVSMLFL